MRSIGREEALVMVVVVGDGDGEIKRLCWW